MNVWIQAWIITSLIAFVWGLYNNISQRGMYPFTVEDLAKLLASAVCPGINLLMILLLIGFTFSKVPEWVGDVLEKISKFELVKGK